MKKHLIIGLHISYWLCYLLLLAVILILVFMQMTFRQKGLLPQHIFFIQFFCVMTILPAVTSFYTAYSVLMPRFLAQKKISALCISGLGVAICSSLVTTFSIALLFGQTYIFIRTFLGVLEQSILPFLLSIIHGVLGLVLSGFVAWFEESRAKSLLQEQNIRMELDLIKAQLDPHFLFNTLNNIDVLIEKDGKRASGYLQTLSAIMRYMLYDAKADIMPLSDEIGHIEKVIELQKIRSVNPDFVNFTVIGDTTQWQLVPMLFIPFIENAFKYALHKKTGTVVNICFTLDEAECIFECSNIYSTNQPLIKEQSGLGNALITRRLELLYPKAHRLVITDKDNIYKVHLTVQRNKTSA